MFQRDYLVRMFSNLARGIRKTIFNEKNDPRGSAETLEEALSSSVEVDGDVLLSLDPESFVSILQVTGTDERLCGYIAHTLYLESEYLTQAGDSTLASVRESQARALADAYNIDLSTHESALNDLVKRYDAENADGMDGADGASS